MTEQTKFWPLETQNVFFYFLAFRYSFTLWFWSHCVSHYRKLWCIQHRQLHRVKKMCFGWIFFSPSPGSRKCCVVRQAPGVRVPKQKGCDTERSPHNMRPQCNWSVLWNTTGYHYETWLDFSASHERRCSRWTPLTTQTHRSTLALVSLWGLTGQGLCTNQLMKGSAGTITKRTQM